MKAFLEKCDKEWFDDFVYLAKQPLLKLGIEVVGFDGTYLDEFVDKTSFNENDIVIGSVEATKRFWQEVGIKTPNYLGYPKPLLRYLDREITTGKFSDVRKMSLPIFVKPKSDVKLFTGFLLEKESTLNNIHLLFPEITEDLEVYISTPLNILSEYRCFVHKNELVGIKHYDGDFSLFPNIHTIHAMIDDYKNESPVAYTLDVAVTNLTHNNTSLIEINDFWAIGGYGLDGTTYVKMIIDRFKEIKNHSND